MWLLIHSFYPKYHTDKVGNNECGDNTIFGPAIASANTQQRHKIVIIYSVSVFKTRLWKSTHVRILWVWLSTEQTKSLESGWFFVFWEWFDFKEYKNVKKGKVTHDAVLHVNRKYLHLNLSQLFRYIIISSGLPLIMTTSSLVWKITEYQVSSP